MASDFESFEINDIITGDLAFRLLKKIQKKKQRKQSWWLKLNMLYQAPDSGTRKIWH